MNFWPRDRIPFVPTLAAPIHFQAISSHFNNPAWEIAQPILANPSLFAGAIDPTSPWGTVTSAVESEEKSNSKEKVSSPWHQTAPASETQGHRLEQHRKLSPGRRDRDTHRDREKNRDDRGRDRNRRHRSRDRRLEGKRGRSRSSSRGEGNDRERRSNEKDDDQSRNRSPRDKRRSPEDDEYIRKNEHTRKGFQPQENISESSPKRSAHMDNDNKYSLEAANYKFQTPNETIMIRGLAQHISENDLRQDILQCGLMPKDIRLIRKKETGVSRGFAFVEFNSTEEALCWMELKQGVLMLQDMYRAIMQFSIVANETTGGSNWQPTVDWDCPKCFAHNFKKRITCYKCLSSKPDPKQTLDNSLAISPHPTTKLVIRNLDALTTEEDLLKEVSTISNIPIQSCRISRDSVTNLSRCICTLEMKNVLESINLFNELTANPLVIQGRKVAISYCKLQPDVVPVIVPAQSAVWPSDQQYTLADVPQLAEYSACLYAANTSQKAAYLQYYTQYYTNQLTPTALPEGTDTNAAAAVAQSAIQMAQTKKAALAGTPVVPTTTVAASASTPSCIPSVYLTSQQLIGNTSIGEPDTSNYVYDESSGYYFDQKTGLYYDAKTQYFYHSQDMVYLCWDAEKRCYQAAQNGYKHNKVDDPKDEKKKEKEKQQDKVKVAKRIAKDMERWAKTLNQKKDVARMNIVAVQQAQIAAKSAATADIAFAVLERKESGLMPDLQSPYVERDEEENVLVASYGGGSESEGETEDQSIPIDDHTDWVKMACLLCKRQFPSKDALIRHQQLSDLHRQNREAWYKSRGLETPSQDSSNLPEYRDRAKERRQKFGIPDTPKRNKLKEKFMKEQQDLASLSYEEPTRAGIPTGNLGNKMLQKMGWSEGMGLGKKNQGRTEIIEATHRVSSAGLGAAGSNLGPASTSSSSSYKDHVKRVAMARFSELRD